jgi:hypothetical protein
VTVAFVCTPEFALICRILPSEIAAIMVPPSGVAARSTIENASSVATTGFIAAYAERESRRKRDKTTNTLPLREGRQLVVGEGSLMK